MSLKLFVYCLIPHPIYEIRLSECYVMIFFQHPLNYCKKAKIFDTHNLYNSMSIRGVRTDKICVKQIKLEFDGYLDIP